MNNIPLGKKGEALAADYLRKKGYQILDHHYSAREGEIDLVAQKKDEIVFVEVKTRYSSTFGYPEEAVTPGKIKKMVKTAHKWLEKERKMDILWRIDIIAIEIKKNIPHFHHLKNITL